MKLGVCESSGKYKVDMFLGYKTADFLIACETVTNSLINMFLVLATSQRSIFTKKKKHLEKPFISRFLFKFIHKCWWPTLVY